MLSLAVGERIPPHVEDRPLIPEPISHGRLMLRDFAEPRRKRSIAKRPAAWTFETLATLRHRLIQRAGRLVQPQGKLTLTMSANKAVQKDLLHFLDCIKDAA